MSRIRALLLLSVLAPAAADAQRPGVAPGFHAPQRPALAAATDPSPQAGREILVTGEWLEANLDRSDLVLLHASADGADYEAGHIPGARMLLLSRVAWEGENGVGSELRPLSEIREALVEVGVGDRSTVVVYGSSPLVAARAWMTLDVVGAGNGAPLFLDGGLPAWVAEGRALTTAVPPARRGRLTLHPRPERLASADWLLSRLGHEDMALLDARREDEYRGTVGGSADGADTGHIPGARRLYWEDLIRSRDLPALLAPAALGDRFRKAGVQPSDTVVVYCTVGMRASLEYLAARVLGLPVKLYDGSWREWSALGYPRIPRLGRWVRGSG